MTDEEVASVMAYLESVWDDEGTCESCGWHALLFEHCIDHDDIEEAVADGVLELTCRNEEDRGCRLIKIKLLSGSAPSAR